MYAGMLVDTNSFKQRVGVRTFESAAKLKDWQADVSRAYEFLEDSYEVTLYKMLLASSAYRYTDSILISVGSEEDEYTREMLAKSSNALLEISGVKAAFTIGKVSRDVVAVSARSYKKINVQVIMENIGGGGHFSMAACLSPSLVNINSHFFKSANNFLLITGISSLKPNPILLVII